MDRQLEREKVDLERLSEEWRRAAVQATDVRDQDGKLLPAGAPITPGPQGAEH